jgi:hypothetical protein
VKNRIYFIENNENIANKSSTLFFFKKGGERGGLFLVKMKIEVYTVVVF